MKKRLIYAFALALGVTALGPASSLRAEVTRTKAVNIPFGFKVDRKTLPSGQYRIEQETGGTEIATLVNTKTGDRVRVLRFNSQRKEGKAVLTFSPGKDGMTLRIS